jgi:GcrA cell cycle regulator
MPSPRTIKGEIRVWTAAMDDALRAHVLRGLTFSQAACAITATFGVHLTRNAAIGRARRLGLQAGRRAGAPKRPVAASHRPAIKVRRRDDPLAALFAADELPPLREARVTPLRIALVDLERGQCRYPYGGDDGETISFCGHPVPDRATKTRASYCAAHAELCVAEPYGADRAQPEASPPRETTATGSARREAA